MPSNQTPRDAMPARLRPHRFVFVASVFLFASGLLATVAVSAGTFTVNANTDTGDLAPGNGSCATGNLVIVATNPVQFAAECTLRAALQEANALSGLDTIEFSSVIPTVAGVVEISPSTALPQVLSPVFIDGYSHPSYDVPNPDATPIINILGGNAPAFTSGLELLGGSSGSVVRGLAITDFSLYGILIAPLSSSGPENLIIQGNHIGINRGLFYTGNGTGIRIENSDNNTIGQVCGVASGCQGKRNLISGNLSAGILIDASAGNRVAGNYIGVNRFGTSALAPFGGTTSNGIGVDLTLTSSGNLIGDTGSIFTGSGLSPIGSGNLVSGNLSDGILIEGPANTVVANFVGTNAAGTAPVGNGESGITVRGNDNVIGGLGIRGNLVSGNGTAGIDTSRIFSAEPLRVSILNNRIGVDVTASEIIGNGGIGIDVQGWDNEVADNVVGGSGSSGIRLVGHGSTVIRNHIGTNAVGDNLGNTGSGIFAAGPNQQIGDAGAGNIIGFNANGINTSSTSSNDLIVANYIGTNAAGDDLGNLGYGIKVEANDIQIGELNGRITGLANTIGSNDGYGIGDFVNNTKILGNYVGTNSVGADLGNDGTGIFAFATGGPDRAIGASLSTPDADVNGAGNIVAFNDRGIVIENTNDLALRGNQFFGNSGPGIDLQGDGLTLNDANDPDLGPNNFQNYPVFDATETFFNPGTGEIQIRFAVPSSPANATYPMTIDFYILDPWLSSGDQVRAHLGSASYAAPDAGSFVTMTLSPTPGTFTPNVFGDLFGGLRATATDANGNTSELSAEIVAVPEPKSTVLLASGLLGLLAMLGHRSRALNLPSV